MRSKPALMPLKERAATPAGDACAPPLRLFQRAYRVWHHAAATKRRAERTWTSRARALAGEAAVHEPDRLEALVRRMGAAASRREAIGIFLAGLVGLAFARSSRAAAQAGADNQVLETTTITTQTVTVADIGPAMRLNAAPTT